MTSFFRSGYYQYDKAPKARTKVCATCPAEIPVRGGKRYCSACYDRRLAETITANRARYREQKKRGAR